MVSTSFKIMNDKELLRQEAEIIAGLKRQLDTIKRIKNIINIPNYVNKELQVLIDSIDYELSQLESHFHSLARKSEEFPNA